MTFPNVVATRERTLELAHEAIGDPRLIEAVTDDGRAIIWTKTNGWEFVDTSKAQEGIADPLVGKRVISDSLGEKSIFGLGRIEAISEEGPSEMATCAFSTATGEIVRKAIDLAGVTILPDAIITICETEDGNTFEVDVTTEVLNMSPEEILDMIEKGPDSLPGAIMDLLPANLASVDIADAIQAFFGGTSEAATKESVERTLKVLSDNTQQWIAEHQANLSADVDTAFRS